MGAFCRVERAQIQTNWCFLLKIIKTKITQSQPTYPNKCHKHYLLGLTLKIELGVHVCQCVICDSLVALRILGGSKDC